MLGISWIGSKTLGIAYLDTRTGMRISLHGDNNLLVGAGRIYPSVPLLLLALGLISLALKFHSTHAAAVFPILDGIDIQEPTLATRPVEQLGWYLYCDVHGRRSPCPWYERIALFWTLAECFLEENASVHVHVVRGVDRKGS